MVYEYMCTYFFLLRFRRPNLITGLKAGGEHPFNHIGPKKLSRSGADLVLGPTLMVG